MAVSTLTEHETFSRLIDAIRMAKSCAATMAQHRDGDRRWLAMAGGFQVMEDKIQELAMAAVLKDTGGVQ